MIQPISELKNLFWSTEKVVVIVNIQPHFIFISGLQHIVLLRKLEHFEKHADTKFKLEEIVSIIKISAAKHAISCIITREKPQHFIRPEGTSALQLGLAAEGETT